MQTQPKNQIEFAPELIYRLPLCGVILREAELWGGGEKPVLLRPKELERYGLPEATINDMVYRASETVDPLPFMKVGRKTLIPRVALEAWILRQAHVKELEKEKPIEAAKQAL